MVKSGEIILPYGDTAPNTPPAGKISIYPKNDGSVNYKTDDGVEHPIGTVSGGGVTDHSYLTGLLSDDHTQYVLADGSRGFTGVVNGVIPSSDTHLTTKGYVDTISGSLQAILSNVAFVNQNQTITGGWTFSVISPQFTISPVFGNDVIWLAKNSSGNEEDVLWARATDNNTYFNYGSGGHFYLRNNDAVIQYDFTDILSDFKDSAITTTSGITADKFYGDGSNLTNVQSVFGSYFTYGESLSLSTTTSTAYQNKVTITTGIVAAGTYRIGWSYGWYFTSTSYDFLGRVQVNNTTTIFEHRQEPQDTGTDQIHPVSGFYYYTVESPTSLTIDLDYCSGSAGNTAGIRSAILEFWRVS